MWVKMDKGVVHHTKYGRGIVQDSRYKGFELRVKFDDGRSRWIRADELSDTPTLQDKGIILTERSSVLSEENWRSRRMIEAFRLGIVPHDAVQEFTFGRELEIQNIKSWLYEEDNSTLLIVGEYGTGKSHLLDFAKQFALQQGFAVSFAEMRPSESPFYKPKRVYGQLVKNFCYPSAHFKEVKDFQSFLQAVFDQGAFEDHIYFKHLYQNRSSDSIWDWIKASDSYIRPSYWGYSFLPGLYDYSTSANIYCYLLSSLGWAAKNILNLKGFLILFYEAESIEINDYSYQAQKGQNFLKALIRTANNVEELLGDPQKSRLDYCRVGFLYCKPSGLKLIFAFTYLDWNYYDGWNYEKIPIIKKLATSHTINLEHLAEEALKATFEHICLLYDSAYKFKVGDLKIQEVFKKVALQSRHSTRLFVKGAVEALDLIRINHDMSPFDVLR